MKDIEHEEIAKTSTTMAHKKKHLSSAMERTSEWISSQEISRDVTVHVDGVPFSMHKFPLVSKSGYMRKLISNASEADTLDIEIPDIPGGAESFELVAKFCYGINFEIGVDNISMLRCAAEYLEMTDDYTAGNLVSRTEIYLNDVALKSLSGAVSVLQLSESLLPMAEKVKLVSRCIDTIADIICKESQLCMPTKTEDRYDNINTLSGSHPKPVVDWWTEDLTGLRIDMFQRVIIAMTTRGFQQYAIGPILMLYAQKSLRGLEIFGKSRKKIELKQEHEKRVVLETIVTLLPMEKNTLSVSFLSILLRASIYLDTTVACRLDLEKRIGQQLGQAVLDDLLIPSYSFTSHTLFDVDTIQRILMNYLEYEMDETNSCYTVDDEYVSPPPSDMERVGKLMENYIAEVASDRNLTVSRFISLAELIPEQSRITEDGMYRAIDIYLKAHSTLSDMERKKVCSLMDCQKLSREACAHAAQNDRLPVQTVVQVLYYEQQRLRDVMSGNSNGGDSPAPPRKLNPYSADYHHAPQEILKLQRENEDLKIELAKTKMRLKEVEKLAGKNSSVTVNASPLSSNKSPLPPNSSISSVSEKRAENTTSVIVNHPPSSSNKPPLPPKSFISSVSKKLGRLVRADGLLKPAGRTKPNKDRRHSIS